MKRIRGTFETMGAVYRMAQKKAREKHETESERSSRHVNEGMTENVNG